MFMWRASGARRVGSRGLGSLIESAFSILVVCVSSFCEAGCSTFNRTPIAPRSRFKVFTVRDVLTTHWLEDYIKGFKAKPIIATWAESPFTGVYNTALMQQPKALMQSAVKGASARGGD